MKTQLRQPYRTFFGTLDNQHRIDIIEALSKEVMNVSSICKKTGYEQSTVSHSLQRLEHCGFVSVKQKGKERIYTLNKDTIKPLIKLMNKHIKNHCSRICH
ncbi:MAG: metalloregulator ArsR/SmtB family transcription factor [Nanoarchaeota archaeon]